jgi:hypothetical protein
MTIIYSKDKKDEYHFQNWNNYNILITHTYDIILMWDYGHACLGKISHNWPPRPTLFN